MDLQTLPATKKCRGQCGSELPLDSFGVQRRGLYGRKSECKVCLAAKESARRAADPDADRAVLNTLTLQEWEATLEFFGHCCAYCLRGDLPMTMDHLVPIVKGGPHTSENVIPACLPCNASKRDKSVFTMLNRSLGPVSASV